MARNAFNLIVSAVVATAATIIAGPSGFAAAASIFGAAFSLSNIALSIFNPSTPSSDLDDIRANSSAYGEPIPIIYNNVRIGAKLVWASDVRAKERGHGGFEYGQDCRWVIAEVPRHDPLPISGEDVSLSSEAGVTLKRLWLNKQLVFSDDDTDQLSNIIDLITTTVTILGPTGVILSKRYPTAQSTTNGIQVITMYFGDPDQMPHPLQTAALGPDNTPAYRGVISIAIDNIPLHLYGNAIPQVEAELTVLTTGTTPDYIVYDPIWIEGRPEEPGTENLGYRYLVSLFASPSYHPDTMIMQIIDNEEYAASPPAIGRRSVTTGEWEETSSGDNKIALIDYGDGPYTWFDFIAPVVWPPTSTKLYTVRWDSNGGADDYWFVELQSDYPFAFVQRSATPLDKGRSSTWHDCKSFSYNSEGSMIALLNNQVPPGPRISTQFSMWHPSSNSVGYFDSGDAGFAGLYADPVTGNVHQIPDGLIIDKHDHLWIWTSAQTGASLQMYLDEFSWSVSAGAITLTHLNRYELIEQIGGLNTWTFHVYGATYNEDTDTILFHWIVETPSTTTPRNPTALGYTGVPSTTPDQFYLTHWDLATRSKKLREEDAEVISYNGTYLTTSSAGDGDGIAANTAGFAHQSIGSEMGFYGDHFPGMWTKQDWSAYVMYNFTHSPILAESQGFFLIDTTSGEAIKYGLWDEDLLVEIDEGDEPGVYYFTGVVYDPGTFCFWAGRRGTDLTGHWVDAEETVWENITEGFGRYFINPGSVPQPFNLQQINEDIAERTRALTIATDTDFSALAEIIPKGFVIDRRAPARSAIETLQIGFLYDIYESDHILKAKLREGGTSVVTIDESEIVADEDQTDFRFVDNNEQERPRYIDFVYISYERDYQKGIQPARIGGGSISDRNAMTINCAVVFEDDEAATTSIRIIRSGWSERETTSFRLPQKYLLYEVADIAVLTRDQFSFEVKFVQNGLGVNWAIEMGATTHDSGNYSITARATVRNFTPPALIKLVPQPLMVVIDTGLVELLDDTIGYFVTSIPSLHEDEGGLWNGATIERGLISTSFSEYDFVEQGPLGGIMQETLSDVSDYTVFDRDNIIKVKITQSVPVSVSEDALQDDPTLNLFWIGANGVGELVQAATVSKKANFVYWFSNLLRGRFGTEQHTSGHVSGETLVAYDKTKFLSVVYDASQIDQTRYWRARNSSFAEFSAVVTAAQTTRRLMPYAPTHLEVSRDSGDNIVIPFHRRSRAPASEVLEDPPLFEETEDYEADIIVGSGAVLRTITTTASVNGSVITTGSSPYVFYAAADQLLDFGSLIPEGTGDIELYQLNAIRGRGYAGRASL